MAPFVQIESKRSSFNVVRLYGENRVMMLKKLNLILFMILTIAFVCLAGCRHNQDLSLLGAEAGDEIGIGSDKESISADLYAKTMVNGLARDILITSGDIIRAMGFITMIPSSGSSEPSSGSFTIQRDDTYKVNNLIINRFDPGGNSMSALGSIIFAKNEASHCTLFSTLDIEYNSYSVQGSIPIDGAGQARIIVSSLSCRFHENVHVDVILNGNYTSGDQSFSQLVFAVDYESGIGMSIDFKSGEISYPNGTLYCFRLIDNTSCTIVDLRKTPDYCEPDASCEVSIAGHTSCMSDENEESGAHCNLGCCDTMLPESNVCNGSTYAARDCNPNEEERFSAKFHIWDDNPVEYEIPINCSLDGLWAPPCPLDGSYDVCPHGGICVPPDDDGWGFGLEEYGYCSCISS